MWNSSGIRIILFLAGILLWGQDSSFPPQDNDWINLEAGPFFNGDNNPIDIKIYDDHGFDIYLNYLPDLNSDQNNSGTWSIATLYFTTISEGRSELKYGEDTERRDLYNNTLEISEMRSGFVDVKDD